MSSLRRASSACSVRSRSASSPLCARSTSRAPERNLSLNAVMARALNVPSATDRPPASTCGLLLPLATPPRSCEDVADAAPVAFPTPGGGAGRWWYSAHDAGGGGRGLADRRLLLLLLLRGLLLLLQGLMRILLRADDAAARAAAAAARADDAAARADDAAARVDDAAAQGLMMLLRRARLRSEQTPARAFDPRRRGIERGPAGRGRGRRRGWVLTGDDVRGGGGTYPAGLAKSGGSEPNASESSPANSVRLLLG